MKIHEMYLLILKEIIIIQNPYYNYILDFRIANGKIDQCAAQGLRASAVGQFTQWA